MSFQRGIMHKRRVEWLVRYPHIWKRHRSYSSEMKQYLFEVMQSAGLYSEFTNWFDTAIEKVAKDAQRKLRRKAKA